MNSTFDPSSQRRASVYANASFICVRSCAGYRRSGDERLVAFLPGTASSEALGIAVIEALDAYRILSEGEIATFFALPEIDERNKAWEAELIQRAGYKSTKELYKGLKHVPVRLEGNKVAARATRKDRRNGWEGTGSIFAAEANLGASAIGEIVKRALGESA